MNKNFSILKYILLLSLGWKVALLFITYFGLSTFPGYNGIDNALRQPSPDIDYWFRWSNWDGGHFRGIVERGYLPQQTVFFPLYPLLMKLLTFTYFTPNQSGLLISHLSLIIALFFLYKLTLLDFKEAVAKRAVFALLIFPTSFYLGAVYSESLFLATTLASFYFTRVNYQKWGGFFAATSVATRLTGITTLSAILAGYLLKENKKLHIGMLWDTLLRRLLIYLVIVSITLKFIVKSITPLRLWWVQGFLNSILEVISLMTLPILLLTILEFLIKNLNFKKLFSNTTLIFILTLLPIPLYIIYQQIIFQNPWGFLTNELLWQRHFTLPWQPVLGYLSYLKSTGIFQIGNPARSLTELVFFLGGLIGLVFSFYKLKPSYTIFYALGLILPTFSGTLIAMPRYMLTIFPIYILLGLIENEILQKIGSLIFILLLAAYSMLFMGWFWVT